jgi:hypothetical protein
MFDYQTSIHPCFDTACRRFSLAHNLTEVASVLGITAQVLRNKLNPMQPHRLTIVELITITDYTDDSTLLDGLLAQLNCLPAVPVNEAKPDNLPMHALSATAAIGVSGLSVYGMRVVEPHHDATPHWHMMLFTKPAMRQRVIDIMRKYAMKEDGDERGAAKNRFDCKHLNRGGAAGYIAKYIAKNIDGYALEGERDHETGELLTDSAAAVTAWAATWRIPQFHPIGLPTMGSYRECRRIRSISLTETFDEEVEAVRAAADAGDFMAYMSAQGGANVPRDVQTVRVARRVANELNAYDEEVKKVVGIFAPHLGDSRVYETRTTQWRIVSSVVDVEVLALKSASGAPRSPVNNCGLGGKKQAANRRDSQAGSALTASNLNNLRVIDWTDTAAVRAIVARIREETLRVSKAQRSFDPTKGRDVAPSARLTIEERARLPEIKRELMKSNITAERWELEALSRGAKISFSGIEKSFKLVDDWGDFYQ